MSRSVDLPIPGSPRDQDQACGHEAAAQDAIELGHAGRNPFRVGGFDLDQP